MRPLRKLSPSARGTRRSRPTGFRGEGLLPAGVRLPAGSVAPSAIRLGRILVPIDFSRASIKPLDYAFALARAHGAKIVLFHVTKPISFCVDCGYGPVNRQVPDEAQARKDSAHLKKAAAKHLPAKFIEDIVIRSGEAAEAIVRTAGELKADLIVLYAHELNEPRVVGSHEVADRVARHAECPVLVVRSHERDFVHQIPRPD